MRMKTVILNETSFKQMFIKKARRKVKSKINAPTKKEIVVPPM